MDAAGPSLKMIANYAVGFDNIDLAEAKRRGIVVTNAAHPRLRVCRRTYDCALFALAHRVVESDHFTRSGLYKGWEPELCLAQISWEDLGTHWDWKHRNDGCTTTRLRIRYEDSLH